MGRYPREFRRIAVDRLKNCDNILALSQEPGYRADVSVGADQPGGILPLPKGENPVEEDMDLRSAIQQFAMEHRRRYGYHRISAELRRRGMLAKT